MIPRRRATLLFLLAFVAAGEGRAQDGPSLETRRKVLQSLVSVRATDCVDQTSRAGSGFALNTPGAIVTAHHVVGGCRKVRVTYEGGDPGSSRLKAATIARILASGDLALLEVQDPPAVPALALSPRPADRSQKHAGFGFQNAQPSADDLLVTFSSSSDILSDILPEEARRELGSIRSPIDLRRKVLRFNVALQPGMSGGPIIDAAGHVVGIVAGGLKAGAAPASWGWPSEWVNDLLKSSEPPNLPVQVAGAYFSLSEMTAVASALQTGRKIACGSLQLLYAGTRRFEDLARGADDQPRLQYILAASTRPHSELNRFEFDVWTDQKSGATAVTPSGYAIRKEGDVCVARSSKGPFSQIVWGTDARDHLQAAAVAIQFEQQVMLPRVPYMHGAEIDQVLTTQGAQFRMNGMIFYRKGFTHPKERPTPPWPPRLAHSFETLIAKSGTFLGVGTVNDEYPPQLLACVRANFNHPSCAGILGHLQEWTHFILATQLSTYPST